MPGRDLEVVAEFEILREGKSLSGGDISKGFEVVHCQSIACDPRTTNLGISISFVWSSHQTHKFCQNIHSDFQTSDGPDDPNGNDAKGAKDDTINHHSGRGVRLPQPNTKTTT